MKVKQQKTDTKHKHIHTHTHTYKRHNTRMDIGSSHTHIFRLGKELWNLVANETKKKKNKHGTPSLNAAYII